jgi:hypothetical protein
MSNNRDLPLYVRAGDVWETIGAPQLRKRADER